MINTRDTAESRISIMERPGTRLTDMTTRVGQSTSAFGGGNIRDSVGDFGGAGIVDGTAGGQGSGSVVVITGAVGEEDEVTFDSMLDEVRPGDLITSDFMLRLLARVARLESAVRKLGARGNVAVPDLFGKPLSAVAAAVNGSGGLLVLGLVLDVLGQRVDTAKPGPVLVVGQYPVPGENVDAGTRLNLLVTYSLRQREPQTGGTTTMPPSTGGTTTTPPSNAGTTTRPPVTGGTTRPPVTDGIRIDDRFGDLRDTLSGIAGGGTPTTPTPGTLDDELLAGRDLIDRGELVIGDQPFDLRDSITGPAGRPAAGGIAGGVSGGDVVAGANLRDVGAVSVGRVLEAENATDTLGVSTGVAGAPVGSRTAGADAAIAASKTPIAGVGGAATKRVGRKGGARKRAGTKTATKKAGKQPG